MRLETIVPLFLNVVVIINYIFTYLYFLYVTFLKFLISNLVPILRYLIDFGSYIFCLLNLVPTIFKRDSM